MKFYTTITTCTFLFLFFPNIVHGTEKAPYTSIPKAVKITESHINGAWFPNIIETFIEEFNNPHKGLVPRGPFFNRIILHGPHGTGKTAIAKYFAQKTNSLYMHISAASLLNTYQNSGATVVKQLFAYLREQTGKVVVHIDEADKMMASNAKDNLKVAMDSTAAELWQGLDSIERAKNIRIILTTNHLDKVVSPGLIERFIDTRVVNVPALDDSKRKEYIRTLFITMQVPENPTELPALVTQLEQENQSLKSDLDCHFNVIQNNCDKLNNELNDYYSLSHNNLKNHDNIFALITTLEKQLDELIRSTQRYAITAQKIPTQIITEYSSLVKEYINCVRERMTHTLVVFNEDQLQRFTDETKDFSIRYLTECICSIHDHVRLHNNGKIKDDSIFWEKIGIVKAKMKRTETELAKDENRKKQREFQENIAFDTAFRHAHSTEYYVPLHSTSGQAGADIKGIAKAGLSHTWQHKNNMQNPLIEDAHKLAKGSNNPILKEASALIEQRNALLSKQ